MTMLCTDADTEALTTYMMLRDDCNSNLQLFVSALSLVCTNQTVAWKM
jgi:hypothetical protein